MLPNSPPDEGVLAAGAFEGAAEEAAKPPPNRLPPVVAVVDVEAFGADDVAGFAPKREPAVPAVLVAAGAVVAAGVPALAAAPKRFPPEAVEAAVADLFPNRPPPEALFADCVFPKSPPEAGAAEDGAVEFGFAPEPNKVVPEDADLERSTGGAPAGVVDGRENRGLAGVAAGAGAVLEL